MSRTPARRRRATLASLAAELEVSRTTISNAYNRPDQLSADLRERVLQTAKRLGYSGPDPVARSLRTRKAGAVGLVLTEALNYAFSDPAAVSFVAGVAESCEEVGQGLLLLAVGPGRSVAEGSQTACNPEGSPFRAGPLHSLTDLKDITSVWVHRYDTSRLMHRLGRRPPAEAEYYSHQQVRQHTDHT